MIDLKSNRIVFASMMFALIWITPLELFAQNGGFAGASTRIGFSARGMAMSNAMSAVTSEGAFSYYNPAHSALNFNTRQIDFSIGALKFDRVFQSTGVKFQLPPTAGISFHLLRTGVNDIDGRTQSGYHTEYFNLSEYQLGSSFGIRMSDRMNAGIGIKFGYADYHQDLDEGISVGVDFGILYEVTPKINFAASVKDLFASYSWNSQQLYSLDQSRNVVNEFPTRYVFGLAWQSQKFTISGEYEIQSYNSEITTEELFIDNGQPTVITNSENINTSSMQLRFGGSWRAHERFTLRGGWQLPETANFNSWGLSSGFSIHLPFDVFSPSIDYAFVMEPYRISNMHVFSIRLHL